MLSSRQQDRYGVARECQTHANAREILMTRLPSHDQLAIYMRLKFTGGSLSTIG